MIGGFIFLALLIGVAILLIGAYNRLVELKNRYQNAYAQIDVQLRRRHDLIPNLVQTVKGYMKHERETLEAVIAARNGAVSASSRAASAPGDPQAVRQVNEAEAVLTGSLGRLFALSESYPDLKADRSMSQLMEELQSTENRIAFSRQAFNDAVTLYNTQRQVFPSNLVAGFGQFFHAELLEESAPEVKEVPQVSFE